MPINRGQVLLKDGTLTPKLEKVLARRMKKKGNYAGTDLLVQWEGYNEENAIWVDVEELQQKYPELIGKLF